MWNSNSSGSNILYSSTKVEGIEKSTKRVYNKKQDVHDFLFLSLQMLEEMRSRIEKESYWTYKSNLTKIRKFKDKIMCSEITEDFIGLYHKYMIEVLGNAENTASKTLRTLRTFVLLMIRHGYMKKNPFQYYKIKKINGKRDFLSVEEVLLLQNYFDDISIHPETHAKKFDANRFPNEECKKEREILRCFLFSCYTGLRYSDIKKVSLSDIKDGVINLRQQKTKNIVTIPLSEKAMRLINSNDEKMLMVYCNKVTNRYLSGLSKHLKIDKRITFHVARHSFATISVSLGIPIEVISKLLGHTDIKTTQIYAKVIDSVKIKEMTKWNF